MMHSYFNIDKLYASLFNIKVALFSGSVVAGMCLDKWKKYKWTTLIIYTSCFVSTLVYTFTLKLR